MQDSKPPVYLTREPGPAVCTRRRKRGTLVLCLLAIWATGAYYTWGRYNRLRHAEESLFLGDPETIWNKLEAQRPEELSWTSCYLDNYECARLKVPLDYSHPSLGHAEVALSRYPAKVPRDHSSYRGPVLLNFGGPGASGVSLLLVIGPYIQELLGQEYDIVSFDPRGIARTTPQIRYFTDGAEGSAFRIRMGEDPVINSTVDSFSRFYSRIKLAHEYANANAQASAPYASTALVARDMLRITNAFGRDKLQYWGFSYGTILGATYAAMFPDNIERLLMDGVMDAEDYYKTLWSKNLLDTDKSLQRFLQECVDAGPARCAIHESSPDKVHARIHRLFSKLQESPVPVLIREDIFQGTRYTLVDYKIARAAFFLFLYAPYGEGALGARWIASALRGLEEGDGSLLWRFFGVLAERFECQCPLPGQPLPPDIATPEAQNAILCVDGDEVHDTVEDMKKHFKMIAETSEFADMIAQLRGSCAGSKIRPVERFTGPFVGNTSFPLLFIGNTADPVTPLECARNMSKGFTGSVVLTQDSAGHCSIAASSVCTAKAIRSYFRDGKLPEPGTVCNISSRMFDDPQHEAYEGLTGGDRVVMNAWDRLSQRIRIPPLGGHLQQLGSML